MNLVEDILSNSNIVDYISKYVSLRRAGSNWTGNCPFHKEKTPSFMVSETKQIFKCFGCGKGGNIITFAMEYERLDFVDALKLLAEQSHLDLNKYPKYTSDPAVKEHKQQAKGLNQVAAQHFQNNLQSNPAALEYLHNRHIDNQIIESFWIGYAPDSYYELFNYLKKLGYTNEQMTEAWLCKVGPSGDMFDFFRKRIIFPIFDVVGNIIAFAGRVLDPKDSPKYINLSDTALYDKSKTLYGIQLAKSHVSEHQCVVIVEGYMDVIGLYRIGLPVGLATCGTALSADHLKQIKRYSDNVYFLFDNDDAGFAATVRWLKIAYGMDIYPAVLKLWITNSEWWLSNNESVSDLPTSNKPQEPQASSKKLATLKDVDDFANAWGTKEELLASKEDGMSFVIKALRSKYDITNPVEKKKILHECFDLIRSIPDLSITQHYLGSLSSLLDISDQIVLSQYKTRYKTNRTYQTQQQTTESTPSMDTKSLLNALLINDNRKQYSHSDQLQHMIDYYKKLQDAQGGASSIENWALPEQELHNWELLRWDHESVWLEEAKIIQLIWSMIKKEADILLKQVIKTSALSSEQKSELLEQRKKLG